MLFASLPTQLLQHPKRAKLQVSDLVELQLTHDEALVLFEYLRRCDDDNSLVFIDQAEERALWNLEGKIEKQLAELFDPRYGELLQAARDRLRDPEE